MTAPSRLPGPIHPAVELPDAAVTAAIETLPSTRRGPRAHLIAASTREDLVKLTGFAGNLLAGQRAEEIASAVRGARGETSTVAVRPAETGDAELPRDVCGALNEPAPAILQAVQELSADVLALIDGGPGWMHKLLTDSVIEQVLRKTTVPVLLLSAPTDFSDE